MTGHELICKLLELTPEQLRKPLQFVDDYRDYHDIEGDVVEEEKWLEIWEYKD